MAQTPPIVHSRANQIALGGYAKGARVLVAGVIWVSTIGANLSVPGEGSGWEYGG